MAGSVYPSVQVTTVHRGVLPCFAASDIIAGAPVRIASGADWAVQMVQSSAEKPLGVARDYAAAGDAVAIFDDFNIVRSPAGASFSRESFLGVVGTSSLVHPISGVTVTYPVLGQVAGTPSVAVGASAPSVWAVGLAWESAAIGDNAAYRIEPRLLSGLVAS